MAGDKIELHFTWWYTQNAVFLVLLEKHRPTLEWLFVALSKGHYHGDRLSSSRPRLLTFRHHASYI